jgi:hypothetical protein
MNLDRREINRRQRIAYRDAGVSIGCRIDDDPLTISAGFLNPSH